jgi:hypothetical protein
MHILSVGAYLLHDSPTCVIENMTLLPCSIALLPSCTLLCLTGPTTPTAPLPEDLAATIDVLALAQPTAGVIHFVGRVSLFFFILLSFMLLAHIHINQIEIITMRL